MLARKSFRSGHAAWRELQFIGTNCRLKLSNLGLGGLGITASKARCDAKLSPSIVFSR